MIMCTSTDPQQ